MNKDNILLILKLLILLFFYLFVLNLINIFLRKTPAFHGKDNMWHGINSVPLEIVAPVDVVRFCFFFFLYQFVRRTRFAQLSYLSLAYFVRVHCRLTVDYIFNKN